jgi:hypothetical protein
MADQEIIRTEAYLSVYHLLDLVCFSSRVPHGSAARLHNAIDRLRLIQAPTEDIRAAEGMSVAIHRLEHALTSGDDHEAEEARRDLQQLGARWLQSPMRLTLN